MNSKQQNLPIVLARIYMINYNSNFVQYSNFPTLIILVNRKPIIFFKFSILNSFQMNICLPLIYKGIIII